MTNGDRDESEIDDIYRGLTPHEQVGVAISEIHSAVDDLKNTAVEEIRDTRRESTVLSYKMVIIGAMFGFLGSFLVSVLLRWYDAGWTGCDNLYLGILGIIAFFGTAIVMIFLIVSGKLEKTS